MCGSDGCGGSCGTCAGGQACGVNGQCGCAPSCSGKSCGNDGCGGVCGTCAGTQTCSGSGQCVWASKSFATDVYPMFEATDCAGNGCHGVGMCSGSVMPKAGSEFSAGQLDVIRAWIGSGASP